ncbi:polysaccharide deacetylase family protein [Dermatophilus congolensis]|uniref:Bifunctional xylanase/deacetylase n=2 Tax=Dermatophilus congolensis TaxID=1863 RepID=A0A239VHQ6_9MICO|nr:polysaccharide deacetylase family protein [Dermatophilus congolensis]MBO3129097.1 polysaccharide deacetylase family protein [Dermatophilus congolensis]MBO3132266.1 polysaccharide deacetylase family protein [Dermatophilus congolensis]MBO3133573.1 polysaccharide deacetylase family protein [Dermatophilus congolensis]MBO3135806.1 polysaccharide deacetylase family protein [Dermatophilus congolensis]MBO3138048.1 polysaccharide deacetylase family protein [Dermatophilus congolensis]
MSDLVHTAKLAVMKVLEHAPDSIGSVSSLRTDQGHWVPTFDDGPTAERTPQILRALAEHDATGTFFVLSTSVRNDPGLLREVVAAGHEIGLHGLDHQHLSLLDPQQIRENLRVAKADLEDVLGQQVRWYRPPYGDQTIAAWREITSAGMTSVLWSSTSHDWNPFVDNDTRVAKATSSLERGAIVLFHDGFASHADGADDGPEPALDRYDLLNRVLAAGEERGLRGRSLGGALSAGGQVVTRPHFNLFPAALNRRRIESARVATYRRASEAGLL